jgi:predicted RNA-binding protein with RPS1 domain
MELGAQPEIEVQPKTHFTGKILKTSLAGALVDIGTSTPAFLHVSQMVAAADGMPIKNVGELVKVGQEVDVWVKRVKEDRIELSMFKPLELDWKDIAKDMIVKGKVVRLEKFGAFIEIGAERPGLIHISELAHGYVRQPGDVVKEGDEIEAQVIDVNKKKKQIKLSLKAMQSIPEPAEVMEPPVFEKEDRRRDNRRKKGKGSRRGDEGYEGSLEDLKADKSEPEPTAMEILLKAAMEKAKDKKDISAEKAKRVKKVSQVQEDILSRTLENKVKM